LSGWNPAESPNKSTLAPENYDRLMTPEPEASETFVSSGPGGVRIVADRLGDPQARAVVFLHGGGQTRRSAP